MAAAPEAPEEVVLQIPDVGLNDQQINRLKIAFHNELVTTLGERAAVVRMVRVPDHRIVRSVE